ncbi:MAG: type II secretion system F family protein [archaeon]|nr:type II secretion system F family protein [archaeon]
MALRIIENTPILRKSAILQKYSSYLKSSEFKVDAFLWIIISVIFSIIIGLAVFVFTGIIFTPFADKSIQLGALFFLVLIDLMIGYPYLKAQQRIDEIEEALPDALRQMSDTLRAGGTYEYALREIANAEYGPLKKEMNEVLRKLEEGENFENSMKSLAENIDSRLVRRTVTIIIDSVYAGAGLANVLEEIAEDVRESHRINKDRKARTVMQVIFMFAAGGFIAPMIFGFVSTISTLLITAASSVASQAEQASAKSALGIINTSIQAYIFIETLATALMMAIMRDGNLGKSIIYFPVLLFIAYLAYIAAEFAASTLVGTVG